MSVSEFSAALKNKALQTWFKTEQAGGSSASKASQDKYRLENVNVLANPVGLYRAGEQTSEKTAFLITKDTVRDLLIQYQDIQDPKVLEELTNVYFAAFREKNAGVAVSRKKITVGPDLPGVYFPNISFDSITNLVNNVMNLKSGELAQYYEKGHVVGLATELLQVTANRIAAVDTKGSTGKSFLLKQLDTVIDYYKRLDLDSANIQPAGDVKVYASVNKSVNKQGKSRYLVELQPREANQKSAREVQATIGTVRKLFSPGILSEKSILELITKLQESVTDPKFQQDLLNMKSSPSFKDMIGKLVVDTIKGVPVDQQYNHQNVFIAAKKVAKPDLAKVRAEAQKQIAAAQKAKKALTATPRIRNQQGRFTSLASLQTMLNLALHDQIQKNMGTGTRRDVLNYRSGRFAESAKVTSMSQSREGMITAYYTYMRNPYGTFSEGGAQSSPRSRDPKLLISKSIREVLSAQVNNRMRAVLA
jgi:hypothetical protein